MSNLRLLPSIDQLLQTNQAGEWVRLYGRPLTRSALREAVENVRRRFPESGQIPSEGELVQLAGKLLDQWTTPSLLPVINATGVVLHTNLGRAPLSASALRLISAVAAGYSNLEYDLAKGGRGSRSVHAEDLLRRLTGAEAALVVNNNAAGVLLALSTLARRRGVVIARSQLVEIGGGFRIPDVMKQSGARLIEVGTTNRVHRSDYEEAVQDPSAAVVMRAHQSNFRIIGFTTEPGLSEIAGVAHAAGLPVVDDLGSGTLLDTARFGLEHEPTVQESLAARADLVCFSGDKLLGGPQAGIIVGRADLLARLRKHPLARAIRADKLCLAGLSATLLHYLKDEAELEIPVWRMISASQKTLQDRAQAWQRALQVGRLLEGLSTVGGGSLPGETLPTFLLALPVRSPNRFLNRLRDADPPVIARLEADQVVLDPRTVLPEQDAGLLAVLQTMLKGVNTK